MLRSAGPDVYDQWVNHEIPFNDPAVVEALDEVGDILKNDEYVNGGFGDVEVDRDARRSRTAACRSSTASARMHRQASFYAANWPEGTDVSEDGDVFAFYLPADQRGLRQARSSAVASS